MRREPRRTLLAGVAAAGVVVSVLVVVIVPMLLGMPAAARARNLRLLGLVALPAVAVLLLGFWRSLRPLGLLGGGDPADLDPAWRAALRTLLLETPFLLVARGAAIGGVALVVGAVAARLQGTSLRDILGLTLCGAAVIVAALVPVALFVRAVLRPWVVRLSDDRFPAAARVPSLRLQLYAVVLSLAAVGIVPPAIVGTARLDRAAALATQAAGGELREGAAAGRALGRTALLLAMAALLGIAGSLGDLVGGRVTSDLERVRDKIAELSRGEVGEPLVRAAVHTTEVRRLCEATNALLARASDVQVGRFLAVERAQEAGRLRTQFFANMSHDLRSPLTSILGFTELLEKGIEGEVEPAQRVALESIRQRGEHVLALVGEILDWARLEARKLELHLVWTPGIELVREAAASARGRVPESITILAEPPAGLPQMLVDRPRVVQALAAFVRAIAERLGQGRITLEARAGEVGGIGPALLVVISTDAADVLPAAEAERALEPFIGFGSDALGLALPVARRLLELHGGAVEVSGAEGRTAFLVALPIGQLVHRRRAGRDPTLL